MRASSGWAVGFLAFLLVLGVYEIGSTTPTNFVWGVMDFPLASLIYHSEYGVFDGYNISPIAYPILSGSFSLGGFHVFPVFKGAKSVFPAPGAYGGYLIFSLVSTEPVNVSIYSQWDLISSLGEGAPLSTFSDVTNLYISVPCPEGLPPALLKGFLDAQLFPSPLLAMTLSDSFIVSIENNQSADVFVTIVNPVVSGFQITVNPTYLFFWAILIFSAVFAILTMLSEVVPRLTKEDIYERNILRSGFKIAFREPIRIIFPYVLFLVPASYLLLYLIGSIGRFSLYWAPFITPFAVNDIRMFGAYVPFALAAAATLPLFLVAHVVVYSRIGAVILEVEGGKERMLMEGGSNLYLLAGVLLLALWLYIDYLFFTHLMEIYLQLDLYTLANLAYFLIVLIPIVVFALSLVYTLRVVSASADHDERSPGDIVSEMRRPYSKLLGLLLLEIFIIIPVGLALGILGVYLLNPLTYPVLLIYSPIVESSLITLLLSGSIVFSVLVSFFFTLPLILNTLLYFRLKPKSNQVESEEDKKSPSWFTD